VNYAARDWQRRRRYCSRVIARGGRHRAPVNDLLGNAIRNNVRDTIFKAVLNSTALRSKITQGASLTSPRQSGGPLTEPGIHLPLELLRVDQPYDRVDPTIQVETAAGSKAGQLDWWKNDRNGGVAYAVQPAGSGGLELLIFVRRAAHSHEPSLFRRAIWDPRLGCREVIRLKNS
jgi:hypothetical protein